MRTPRRIFLAVPILCPWIAWACKCEAAYSPCDEAKASDLIFVGTVESIEPNFLNRWNVSQKTSLGSLDTAFFDALQNPSATSLAKLKDVYLKMFPDIPEDQKQQFQSASTPHDLSRIFFSTLAHGERVRFKVKTLFKNEDDDDDDARPPVTKPKVTAPAGAKTKNSPKKNAAVKGKADKDDDDDDEPAKQAEKKKEFETVVVETDFGDCGVDFQAGETYLVYANSDEGSGTFSTGSCTRTRRLSDSGQDLPYLSFYKENPKDVAQLEGWITNNEHDSLDLQHYRRAIDLPVEGAVIKLESATFTRYAESDAGGRFVFDGLREGDYRTTVYTTEYPLNVQVLAGPKGLRIAAQSCATQILWVPK
jgi:hypothetical protein